MIKIYQEKEKAKYRLASILLGRDISKVPVIEKAFIVDRLSSGTLSHLLTPAGIRQFMLGLA